MRILTLAGSPRKKGNTNTLLSAFEALAAQRHSVERIHIPDYSIHGCLGCDACQNNLEIPGCVQKDDARGIFEQMLAADAIVYASPVYVWDFTAQMKTLMDRQYALVKWNAENQKISLLAGKHTLLLVTCGGPLETNADLVQQIFDRQMDYAGCCVVGHYAAGQCTTPRELGDRTQQIARQMLEDLERKTTR